MSFSLLAPVSLVLGLLVAGPILAHMARQKPVERVPFGAMMLLARLVKRIRRQRRLRDLILLLLRILVVLLIVLAATQPRLRWQGDIPEIGKSGRVVFLMDTSMSMGQVYKGQTLLATARDLALDRLKKLPIGAQVVVVPYGGKAVPFSDGLHGQLERARANIEGLQVSHGDTDLSGALHSARRMLASGPGEVLVFSDEAGPVAAEEAVLELELLLGSGASVIPLSVGPKTPRNIAVVSAKYGEGLEGGSILTRIMNYGPDPKEVLLTVGLPDGSEIAAFVDVGAYSSAEEQVTVPPEVPGGVAWAKVKDADLSLDDVRYFHLPRVGASRVLVVDGDPGATAVASEVYFLERALAPWGGARGGVLPEVKALSGLADLDEDRHRVVILANVSDPGPYAAKLVDFVRQGGGLIITGGENVTNEGYNGPLRDLLPAPLRKRRNLVNLSAIGGIPLALPNAAEPLFSAFSRGGRGALTKITARRVLTFESFKQDDSIRVLAEWEGGIPALVERKVGRGRVLVWTSTFDLGWGNAPIQSAFMPLIQRMISVLGAAGSGDSERLEVRVGEPVSLNLPLGLGAPGPEPLLTGPDGSVVAFKLEGQNPAVLRFHPRTPGAYSLGLEGAPPMAWIAANVPAEESDVRVTHPLAEVEAEIAPELFMREARLSRPLLRGAMLFFLLQAIFSKILQGRQNESA
jgi:hypothetical protein